MASVAFIPRVAIVTGAAQGIGRAIALKLADEGLDIGVNDILSNKEKVSAVVEEIRRRGRQAIPLIADVSDEEPVKAMIRETVEKLGRLDVMVANAGIGSSKDALLETSVEHWDTVMRINARGVMLCYKYAAEQMIKQGYGGRILGASSVLGKHGARKLVPYCASKFAVRGLTEAFALELIEHKITVNTYAPGVILTDLTVSEKDASSGGHHGAALKSLMGAAPDGPDAGPEPVASVVAYLIKPEAYFITGQTLTVDGGLMAA